MKNIVWPSLNGEGWITDPARILNTSFAHTLASDVIQTGIYSGSITSMTDIIVRNQNNPTDLMHALENAYTVFYNRIFDSCVVNATYNLNPDSSYSVNLAIVVYKDSVPYSLSYTGPMDVSSLQAAIQGLT
jgi:recombinational DNA repair protein RecT